MANDNKLVNLADLKEAFDDVKESIPSKISQLTNDSGYITGYTETDPTVPSWAKASSKPSYSASEVGAKSTQSAVNSPIASGTALAFIDTISQNAQGVITPTKKTVASASQSAAGLMSADDKKKLDGIASGATANTGTVTSVATGVGLTGGTITGSGTVKAKLKTETALSNDSTAATETSGRVYPVAVDKSGYLAVNVPWTDSKPVTSVAGKTGAVTLAKGDVGLGNVDNKSSATIRGEITSSNVTTALGYTPLNASLKGANSGIAELDSNGKVPSSQLPSYVDDVLEYAKSSSFPTTGEAGKIYIAQDTNKTYRWSGTAYVEISASLALGTTSSTAYRGDYGNAAYAHAVTNKGSAFSSGLYKITTNSEGHVTGATAVAKSDITGLGIPGSDTTYTFDGTYNASTNKAATVSTVTNAIAALDGNLNNTTPGAGKTLTAFSETDGKVSATFGNISITKSQVSDLGTIGAAAAKGVDTSISASSTSTNLPTSQAVAAFVEGKGYKTTDNNTTYSLTQDSSNGHKITLTPSSGTAQTITIPDNNTWRPVSDSVSSTSSSDAASSKAVKTAYDLAASKTANTGTVTSVATGVGLTGGTITGSGTLKAKLRSETALTIDSAAATTTSGRVYPVAVDKTGYLAVNVPWTDNNTTYSAGTGLSLSGTTFSNSGVTSINNQTGAVSISPSSIGAVSKSGDNMTGRLGVLTRSYIYGDNEDCPELFFNRESSFITSNKLACIFATTTIKNNKEVCDRLYFRHYSYNSSGDSIESWEQYALPIATEGLAANDRITYDILTTKQLTTQDLTVQHSGDTSVIAKNTSTGAAVYLNSDSSGAHGIWSDGYYNGSNFVSDKKFLIVRKKTGEVAVHGKLEDVGDTTRTVGIRYYGNTVNPTGLTYLPMYQTDGNNSSNLVPVNKNALIASLIRRVRVGKTTTINAGSYVKFCNYSDILPSGSQSPDNIISANIYSGSFSGALTIEMYDDGVYVYSSHSFTNKTISINFVYITSTIQADSSIVLP